MLTSWFWQQKQAYWLVSAEVHQQAIKQNNQLGFSEALPLFHGEAFAEVILYSPWLIPMQSGLHNVDSETFSQGIVLVSNAEMWDVMGHLRSLLYAALDGEEVMFRFYDPKVLAPMFSTFNQDEINAFLGNCQSIAFVHEQELREYNSTRMLAYEQNQTTWWKIKPQHLEPLYTVKSHAKAIERRLWEKMPAQMNQLESPFLTLQQALLKALDTGVTTDKAEQIALITFIKQTHVDYWTLAQALLLDDLDIQELKEIEKEMMS